MSPDDIDFLMPGWNSPEATNRTCPAPPRPRQGREGNLRSAGNAVVVSPDDAGDALSRVVGLLPGKLGA